jgi:hypothetical protein
MKRMVDELDLAVFVEHDKEKIKTRHNGGCHGDIALMTREERGGMRA